MSLQDQIAARRVLIKTDSYAMSIGELMNIYQGKELDLHPDFQRFYRWTLVQKTRLIESILLGIPLPPVFVSQREDGVWDVIDGLQRLSAIFQFAGMLRRADGTIAERLELEATKYLPGLEGVVWQEEEGEQRPADKALTAQQRIDLKRAKIDVNIILRESDRNAQYDMFERLNTGGTQLSEQEVRNCLLLMINKPFYAAIEEMSGYVPFQTCVALTDRQRYERYDMELIVRMIVLDHLAAPVNLRKTDVGSLLTDTLLDLAASISYDLNDFVRRFHATFDILDAILADDSFRRFDVRKMRFVGASLVSAFEIMAVGLAKHVDRWSSADDVAIRQIAQDLWSNPAFTEHQGSGVSGADRIPHTLPLGRALFER